MRPAPPLQLQRPPFPAGVARCGALEPPPDALERMEPPPRAIAPPCPPLPCSGGAGRSGAIDPPRPDPPPLESTPGRPPTACPHQPPLEPLERDSARPGAIDRRNALGRSSALKTALQRLERPPLASVDDPPAVRLPEFRTLEPLERDSARPGAIARPDALGRSSGPRIARTAPASNCAPSTPAAAAPDALQVDARGPSGPPSTRSRAAHPRGADDRRPAPMIRYIMECDFRRARSAREIAAARIAGAPARPDAARTHAGTSAGTRTPGCARAPARARLSACRHPH